MNKKTLAVLVGFSLAAIGCGKLTTKEIEAKANEIVLEKRGTSRPGETEVRRFIHEDVDGKKGDEVLVQVASYFQDSSLGYLMKTSAEGIYILSNRRKEVKFEQSFDRITYLKGYGSLISEILIHDFNNDGIKDIAIIYNNLAHRGIDDPFSEYVSAKVLSYDPSENRYNLTKEINIPFMNLRGVENNSDVINLLFQCSNPQKTKQQKIEAFSKVLEFTKEDYSRFERKK